MFKSTNENMNEKSLNESIKKHIIGVQHRIDQRAFSVERENRPDCGFHK